MKGLAAALLIGGIAWAQSGERIVNDTDRAMICFAVYPSRGEMQTVKGVKRYVRTHPREEERAVLAPGESYRMKREGDVTCYNERAKIVSRRRGKTRRIDERGNPAVLESFRKSHERFDLRWYEGKSREDVGRAFGIPQRCGRYKEGEYCNHFFGLDIYYDADQKVKKIFLYGRAVADGRLPFTPESILGIRAGRIPLGLWVQKSYERLFAKTPDIVTENLIMWRDLSPGISRVILTPKWGHFPFSLRRKNGHALFENAQGEPQEHPVDYLGAVQVDYR